MGDDNWSRQQKFMSLETIQAISTELKALATAQEKPFSVVLHGGEPLLLGETKLKQLLSSLRDALPLTHPISIQTNGVLITENILDICSAFQTSVAVSIDGPAHIHNASRVTHQDTGSFAGVMQGIDKLKVHPAAGFLNAGLLAVIDPASDPREIYLFFKELGAPSVDFLYKDGNYSRLPIGKSSILSTEYGEWMSELLYIYLNDPDPVPIRVLDDMLKVLLGGIVSKEGLGLTDFGILIIDTDGTITKNDTLKSAFNGADRFETPININTHNLLHFLRSSDFQAYRQMQRPSCNICRTCPQLNLCGGGMILHRWKDDNYFNNPSVYCADQLYLIHRMRLALAKFSASYA
jgi:uncharacterized protein